MLFLLIFVRIKKSALVEININDISEIPSNTFIAFTSLVQKMS